MSKRLLSGINVTGTATLNTVANAGLDTDKFLVLDAAGNVDFRTGDELKIDIGANVVSRIEHEVKLGETMTIGTPVYIGVDLNAGTNMTVYKATNATEAGSSKTIGLIASSGITNDLVEVVTEGLLEGLNTSTATKGDPVWLGVNGALLFGLANKPVAPAHMVFLGIVTRVQQNNGEIFVKVQNGFEMNEIHNYLQGNVQNNEVIVYESATSLYKPKSIPTILGYTPVPDSRTLTINGTTYDLSANRAWTITTDASARSILRYVATANQTTFTISGGYTPGLTDVYRNGVKLDNETDFTATNGTTIVLTNGASVNDVIEVYRYQTAFLANNALRTVTEFIATAGQTTFNVTYNSGLVDVFYNGSKLLSTEYTAGNGTSIVLNFPCNLNDTLEVHAYSYQVGAFTGQAQLNGTGFVKANGTTITYDNSTYLTSINSSQVITALGYTPYNATNPSGYITSSALSAYLPLIGGTLTGALNGTSATFSNPVTIGNYDGQALKLQTATATGSSYIRFYNSTGGAEGYFGLFNNAGTNYMVLDAANRHLSFYSSNKFTFEGSNMSIGTTSIINQISGDERIIKIYNSNASSLYLESSVRGYALTSTASGNLSVYDYTSAAYRFIINPSGHVLIGQTAASGSTNGIYFRPGIESGFIVTNDVALQLSRFGTSGDIQTFYFGSTRVGKVVVADGVVKFESANNGGISVLANGNATVGAISGAVYKLGVAGSIRSNRSIYNWYNGAWQGNGTYWHMKTNMWAGGSPNGNTQYTMSYFKGYSYSYSGSILEGSVGFHNYNGLIYSYKTTGNIFSNVYVSSDGYVVIVVPSGQGETGITIDWHQHWEYPFVEAVVTNAALHSLTTGRY